MEIKDLKIEPHANLSGADLRGANLRGANLLDADLRYADLFDADLRYADLFDANLRCADLRCADLREANLWNCIGNGLEIKSLQINPYLITWTKSVLQIGCENHTHVNWWNFSDKDILEMENKKALKFWRKWKSSLQQIIEISGD